VQLDEPSFACHPDRPEEFLDVIARTVEGITVPVSLHVCFGNYRGRAVGHRSYRPLFPHLARAKVSQLALEFASREMAEIELARWEGSGDVAALARANCYLVIPPDREQIGAGEWVSLLMR